ncbi:MAG: hypothetical protein CV082_08755 [Candidatus Brocadia sp. BL1]|nr:MAG: hypothetical protein CV082_08755 [Candidatus Brocadia sp. BL1]
MLMETRRGSIEAIKEIVRLGNRISVDEMAKISDMALALDGSITSVDPDGDWCGTGRIRFKWPPKKNEEFIKLLDHLVRSRINHEVLINGIPAPDHIIINVSRQIGQRLGR